MLLFELLGSYDLKNAKINHDSSEGFTAVAKIGNREIEFEGYEKTNHWKVDFAQVWNKDEHDEFYHNMSYNMTGGGRELEVLSFAIECVKHIIQKYHPKKIVFDAKKSDRSRVAVYEKILKKKLAGYRYEKHDNGPNMVRFELHKE